MFLVWNGARILASNQGQPNAMFWMNAGNTAICMIVFALVLRKKYSLRSERAMERETRVPLYPEYERSREEGNMLMQRGRYEEAVRAYDVFLTHVQDNATALNEALCLEKLGRRAEALPLYQQLAENDVIPELVNGSNCLRSFGDIAGALEYANRATRLAPDDPAAWIDLTFRSLPSDGPTRGNRRVFSHSLRRLLPDGTVR